jgi:hypothetical protein
MKILIASTPATGHLNPLLAIGRILIAEGHDVAFLYRAALCTAASRVLEQNSTPFPGARTSICAIRIGGSRTKKHTSGAGLAARRRRACIRSTPSLLSTRACSRF